MNDTPTLTAAELRIVLRDTLDRAVLELGHVDPERVDANALARLAEQFHEFGRKLSGAARRLAGDGKA